MSNIFPSKQAKQDLLTLLKILGGCTVEVSFSGGGDSGSIDHACLLGHENVGEISLENVTLPWPEKSSKFDESERNWVETTTLNPAMPVKDILISMTEQALENEGLDWYNNEGGQGRLTIDLTSNPPTINLNVGINRTETDDYDFDYSEFDDESEEGEPTQYADLDAEEKVAKELLDLVKGGRR